MTARGCGILVAHCFKSGSARFVAVVIFVLAFAQSVEVREAAAGSGFVIILGALLAASVRRFDFAAVLTGSFGAFGANCCRDGAEGDCKGDCAEGGGVLQQNRVLLGVATP